MSKPNSDETFEFSEEVKRRLGSSPFVVPKGVDESSDPYEQTNLLCAQPNGAVQAKAVPGTKAPGYSEIYRNVVSQDRVISSMHPSVRTMYDAFKVVLSKFPNRDCLGERVYDESTKSWAKKYKYYTYSEIAQRRTDFAAGLVRVVAQNCNGLTPSPNSKYIVGIYGPNCVNWIVADLACQTQALTSVCLYDTLGPETSEYILNFTKSPVLILSSPNIPKILRLKSKLPHLKVIISLDRLTNDHEYEPAGGSRRDFLAEWSAQEGVALYTMDEVEDLGKTHPIQHQPPTRDDIYAINFTSGTTGNPKGALLPHSNIVAAVTMCRSVMEYVDSANAPQKTFFSLLPLAHIYERITMNASMYSGVRQAYPHGPLTEIMDDIAVVKPHGVAMVPRILNRIATAIKSVTIEAEGLAGNLSRKAHAAKLARLHSTGNIHHPIWDALWSRKIRKNLGFENLEFVTTGSAPLSKENIDFLKVALSAEIVQGYGLTESNSGVCLSQKTEANAGSCGPIAPTCEVRLRDVPDYGYSSDDKPEPRGEIMLRGPQIFRGYYMNEEKTLEAFDEDGWFHTGDVGKIDALGRIHIIDRVKNFFKLAQGEYIGAEKIENVYLSRSSHIGQIFVHGESTETFLVAIAGVNPDIYAPWVSRLLGKRIAPTDIEGLSATFNDEKVRKEFLKVLNKAVEPGVLQGFERIKNIVLGLEPLSPNNDTMTPTLKVKRNVAAKVFANEVKQMYKEGPVEFKESKL
uniref:ARAD1A09768p n=1 Tax=Blastobotrys adeninivorans TaxID=409370 RepID=A0A060SX12_BLAAD